MMEGRKEMFISQHTKHIYGYVAFDPHGRPIELFLILANVLHLV